MEIRHGQYPVTGRFSDDVGDKDEGMAAVKLAECGDIGGFVAVVDFLAMRATIFRVAGRRSGIVAPDADDATRGISSPFRG